MSNLRIVGFAGSTSRPSRTQLLVDRVVRATAARITASHHVYDLWDLLPELGSTLDASKAPERVAAVLNAIRQADALVVGSPVYKGTYTGLFKHLFDLLDPKDLKGKPVVLTATGGSPLHALSLDHGLRPLFAFFGADVVATGVYATEADFAETDGQPSPVSSRIDIVAHELAQKLRNQAVHPQLARIA